MGQKIHPTGFRLALNKNWASRWYANNKNFSSMLLEDVKVREAIVAARPVVPKWITELPN